MGCCACPLWHQFIQKTFSSHWCWPPAQIHVAHPRTSLPCLIMLQYLRFKMLFSKALAVFLPKSLVCRTAHSQQHVSILLAQQPRQGKSSTLISLAFCKLRGNVCQHRECSLQSGTPQPPMSQGETESCCRLESEGKGFYPSSISCMSGESIPPLCVQTKTEFHL